MLVRSVGWQTRWDHSLAYLTRQVTPPSASVPSSVRWGDNHPHLMGLEVTDQRHLVAFLVHNGQAGVHPSYCAPMVYRFTVIS